MWRCLLFLIALTILSTAYSGSARGAGRKAGRAEVSVSWQFDTRRLEYDLPDTKVYLVVDGRRIFLLRASSQFSVLERELYSGHDVPATAIAACAGWWAGQGQDLYVTRRGRRLIVFARYLDEQAPVERYRRLKVIPLPG
jgi:hypothetical protein